MTLARSLLAAFVVFAVAACGSAGTTPPVASPQAGVPPEVSAGWSLETGDVLVSNGAGVHLVRDGATVANPVTSAVDSAFADGSGGIVLVTPNARTYPDDWPGLYGSGGHVLWRIHPDGSASAIFISEAPADQTWGNLTVYGVETVAPVSDGPSAIFTRRELTGRRYSWDWDRIWVLPLNESATPTLIPVETPAEGGVTGLGWQPGTGLLMATEGDRGSSLSIWSVAGDPIPWMSPIEGGDAYLTAATIRGTDLIAYTEEHAPEEPIDLVIFDLTAGTEQIRTQIFETADHRFVRLLHASDRTVAISPLATEAGIWVFQPVLLFDLATGTLTELPIEGVATLVP